MDKADCIQTGKLQLLQSGLMKYRTYKILRDMSSA